MDVIYVAYNSEKWIDDCFQSLINIEKPKQNLKIWIVDNHSEDLTVSKLELWKEKFQGVVEEFHILEMDSNLGFGAANNYAANLGKEEYICFINIDTQVFQDTFTRLEREIEDSNPTVGIWEMRQLPYEHPKLYNPINGDVSWCSGAAMTVRREVFEKVRGFDSHMFMYGEDVDLSWRIREKGYYLKYCPGVVINHFSYQYANEIKKTQFIYGIKNNLFLRYRFGSVIDILKGHVLFAMVLFGTVPKEEFRKAIFINYLKHFGEIPYWLKTRSSYRGKFQGWEFEYKRDETAIRLKRTESGPLVSVVVRTCGRPNVLREALLCLKRQTYENIEIIVVEDGSPISESMVKQDFAELNLHYYCTKEKKGRSHAGNYALEKTTGKFINFLDDDDLFFDDHIETLISELIEKRAKVAYSFGIESTIRVIGQEPYEYEVKRLRKRYADSFDKLRLCYENYMPIQCVMFSRTLYEELGGFDETLEYLEDWDLWLRYATQTDFVCVPKTTSIYRVPADKAVSRARQKNLDMALENVRAKEKNYYLNNISANDIARLWSRGRILKRG